ncbi:MAG: potassium transporter Kup [Burkholderiaceae bacterium]
MNPSDSHKKPLAGLTLVALGVVFGDIGTSPLYSIREVFDPHHGVGLTQENIIGSLSLMFWSLMMVVSLKYVALVLRADNRGEGGIMALLALAASSVRDQPRLRRILLMIGVFGAALFFGDGVLTPAISILSAIEGLEVATPAFRSYVVPAALAILIVLYCVQRRGTAAMGKLFAPVMVLWFGTLGVVGAAHVFEHPHILEALNPYYALEFFFTHGWVGYASLGSTVLVLTGAEALYADMGHFGRTPIRICWFAIVLPSLVLNYFGQGALLLGSPAALENPFFLMFPSWALYPAVGLATAATIVASQATISGTYSMTKQAIQLGFLPRLSILYTSDKEAGQIYVPFVNWAQLATIVLLVVTFGSSSRLAGAYGVAVTGTMLMTTILTFFVIRYGWGLNWVLCVFATGVFLLIDIAYFTANLLKLLDGGWLPLVLGGIVLSVMLTWKRGREIVIEKQRQQGLDLGTFLQSLMLDPPDRVAGTAVFLVSDIRSVPGPLLHNLLHNKILHERVVFLTVETLEIPWVPESERVELIDLGQNFWKVKGTYGFKNEIDVPRMLELCAGMGLTVPPMETSYFIGRETIVPTPGDGMAMWRERLFATISRNAGNAAEYFKLPANRVIELGTQIEI